jgi:hypothetical protein
MKLPKRFALSTLLKVMLLASMVFGYAQWRRQRLFAEIVAIGREVDLRIGVTDGWFWPTIVEPVGIITPNGVFHDPDGILARLKAIGVDRVVTLTPDG